MAEMLEPISLGFACDVKYQASRNLYGRLSPGGDEMDFRNSLFRTNGTASPFRRHVFDWMIAPRAAVCAYLESDFKGVFEREDFDINPQGLVEHRRLATIHPHDFHAPPGQPMIAALLDAQYPAFRSKYDYLAERFRRHLQTPGPYLYIYHEVLKLADARRLAELLQSRSPQHRFQMLFVGRDGAVNQVLNDPRFHKGWIPVGPPDKEPVRQWEGDDAAWDKVLNGFHLGLHESGGAAGAQPVAEAAADPPPAEAARARERPPKTGWRVLTRTDTPEEFFRDYLHVDAEGGRQRLFAEGGRHGFDRPEPDDHVFCHFIPAVLAAKGGWARLTLRWPRAAASRAAWAVQDQDCNHGAVLCEEVQSVAGAVQQTLLMRMPPGGDQLRLVWLPSGADRSDLPLAIVLEAHEPAAETPGPLERLKRLFVRA
jgi:hypothetical protein